MKTYIVAKDYEDGHQLTRFVTTDDEKELRKHWTRIARVEPFPRWGAGPRPAARLISFLGLAFVRATAQ